MNRLVESTHQALKTVSELVDDVDFSDGTVERVIEEMGYVLDDHPNGVGLAAPQLGHGLRIIMVRTPDIRGTLINPVITKSACGTFISREGCLSFPDRAPISVERAKQITVKALTPDGEEIKRKFRGLTAAVIQHEIDHLDGKTIYDEVR